MTDINRTKLALGLLATAVGALSIHVVMLQEFDVPGPDLSVIPGPARLLIKAVATLALILLCRLGLQDRGWPFLKRWGALFLLATMLNENLVRSALMQGYCTDAWVFAFAGNLPKLAGVAASSALIVAASPKLVRAWQQVLAAVLITALGLFAIAPLLGAISGPLMEAIAHRAPQGEWCALPYGANVLVPAYLSFAEPALAAVVAAALLWSRLAPSRGLRYAQLILLILSVKNQLLMPFAYAAFAKLPPLDALVSESQFALEAVALALLAGLTWERSLR